MSASLVGSEMCIRDSFYSCAASAHVLRPSLLSQCSGMVNKPLHEQDKGCLLYTSDAADDM
eukprot:9702743-Alexandrium_andersonii.AAC.1